MEKKKFFYDRDKDFVYWELRILLEQYEELTFSEITKLIKEKNPTITPEKIFEAVQDQLIHFGTLIRKENWIKETTYQQVDKHRQDSSFTRHYFSFNYDVTTSEKFLLISDTHIGKEGIEDFLLLNNIYEYAVKEGVKIVFHLGDLFAGKFEDNYLDFEEAGRQIDLFNLNYPKVPEIKTYCLLGNHDKPVDKIMAEELCYMHSDLRQLTYENPSFYMIPRDRWHTKFNNIAVNFSHPLYINWLIRDHKLHKIEELEEMECWLDEDHQVQISGHLHRGIIYTVTDHTRIHEDKIFLGVPSTSQINLGRTVGYLVTLNQTKDEIESLNITLLNSDLNRTIHEEETFNWSFTNNNKVYRKCL